MDEIEIVDVIIKKKHRDSPRRTKLHERNDPLLNSRQIFKCPQCNHIFSDENSLKIHVNFHLIETKYKPPFPCQEYGMYDQAENIPLQAHSEQEKDATTGKACETIMYTNQEYNKQEKTWSECSPTFKRQSPVINHMTNQSTMLFICSLCRQPFNDKVSFKNHVISHSRDNNFPFMHQNLLPSRENEKSDELSLPVKRESPLPLSTGEKAFYLEIPVKQENQQFQQCLETFNNLANMNQSVSNQPQNTIIFPHCSQSFNEKQNLKTHVNIHCSKDTFGEMFQHTNPLNDSAYLRDNSSSASRQASSLIMINSATLQNVLKQENNVIPQCTKTCNQESNMNRQMVSQVEQSLNSLPCFPPIDIKGLKTHKTIQCIKNMHNLAFQNSDISGDITYLRNNNSSMSAPTEIQTMSRTEESTVTFQNSVKEENHESPQCVTIFSQLDNKNQKVANQSEQLFRCRHCSQSFKDEEELRKHVNIHFDKKKCNDTFVSHDDLFDIGDRRKQDLLHSREHLVLEEAGTSVSSNREHQHLPVCTQTFESESRNGSATFYSKELDKSTHCNQPFKSGELSNRLDTNLEVKKYTCPFKCQVFLKSKEEWKNHVMSHPEIHTTEKFIYSLPSGEYPFLCKYCNRTFRDFSNARKHVLNVHYAHKTINNACIHCKKKLSSASSLRKHILRMHVSDERPYACTYCKKTYKSIGNVKAHMRQVHLKERRFKCTHCEKAFGTSTALKIHVRMHKGELPYKCPKCSKGFSCFYRLKLHARTHTGDKPYTCPLCQKSFRARLSLKDHLPTHSEERSHKCPQCQKAFKTAIRVKVHMNTMHPTTRKSFKCSYCSKSFSTETNRRRHLRIHSEDRPYKCPVCDKTCNRVGNLKTHMRMHTGEKPYTCPQCKKSFTRMDNLKTHLRMHLRSGEPKSAKKKQ